ncbi:MAG: succinate dehydrogenase assembly factor 4 [Pseudomonadota bacterium]
MANTSIFSGFKRKHSQKSTKNAHDTSPAPSWLDARTRAENLAHEQAKKHAQTSTEVGGPHGLEPTRYGDWEKAGRCFDF